MQLLKIITQHGGIVRSALTSLCTHVVCGRLCGQKVRLALGMSAVHIVPPWYELCQLFVFLSMPPSLLFFFFSFSPSHFSVFLCTPPPPRFLSLPQSNHVSSHTPLRIELTAKLSNFRPLTRISKSISGQEKVHLPRSVSADSFLQVEESTVRFNWTRSGLMGCYPKLSTLRFANYACLHKAG